MAAKKRKSYGKRTVPKKAGVYCVTIGVAKRANRRCVRRYANGKVRWLKKGNIQCPKTCRRK